MPQSKLKPGQIFVGSASRYVFPPDGSDWWNELGSYEMEVLEAGRVWFTYRSTLVAADGTRTPSSGTKRARIEELLKEVSLGVVVPRPTQLPDSHIDAED
ncbi:MAG TPA: hypothetical protein VEK08_25675 [Planctomycetota bacterium]|nr:hypothetical protein [Planctomycetota bacterium]